MATYPDSLLILNGKSAGNDLLRQAIQVLREDGARIHVRVTWEKGDAARYINEALGLGVKMHHLPAGVHTGIGTPGAHQ